MSDPKHIHDIWEESLIKKLLESPELQSLIDSRAQMKIDAMHIQRDYYTPEEYASIKKIKKQTVYKLCRDKHLQHERVGNSIRIIELR